MAKSVEIHNSSESSDDDDEIRPRFTLEPVARLLLMPDDCLHAIMQFLGPVDLYTLSRIADRMNFLASDKILWKRIDFRPHKLTSSQLKDYLNFFNDTTIFIALQGFVCRSSGTLCTKRVITPQLLKTITLKCPVLETLILEAVAFEISLAKFPASLRYLSLKKSIVIDLDPRRSYFEGMHKILPNLKVLILSKCRWVSPHDFMSICKCTLLEELRMDGCPQLGECVAYTSLAARFGFPSLKILDLRNTRMCDSDVSSFSHTLTLSQLYLQSPASDSDDSDDGCCEPACKDDFTDSSDDEDVQLPSNLMLQARFPVPLHSSLSLSQQQSKEEKDCVSKNENERELPQGVNHMHLNPAGPSSVRIGQKHNRATKRPSGDSGSSSDDDVSTSGRSKRRCVLNNNNIAAAVAGCSTSGQLPPTPIIIISSSSEGTSGSGIRSDSQKVSFQMANNFRFNSNLYHHPDSESTITDVCVMSYVLDDMEADHIGYVRIVSPESMNARSQLHTLALRNYRMITDVSLQYLLNLPSLRYLDVSGTSVTEGGVLQFKLKRPDVYVVSDFEDLPV